MNGLKAAKRYYQNESITDIARDLYVPLFQIIEWILTWNLITFRGTETFVNNVPNGGAILTAAKVVKSLKDGKDPIEVVKEV